MTQPTSEILLEKALARAPAIGRNNAGSWLAKQLHSNRYAKTDAQKEPLGRGSTRKTGMPAGACGTCGQSVALHPYENAEG